MSFGGNDGTAVVEGCHGRAEIGVGEYGIERGKDDTVGVEGKNLVVLRQLPETELS